MASNIRLPPEILHTIFGLACTDGGRTACSLRLVSRYMLSVVNKHRFQTVFISSFNQGMAALNAIADAGELDPDTVRVNRLFFAEEYTEQKDEGVSIQTRRKQNIFPRQMALSKAGQYTVSLCLQPLLLWVAPHLRSLSLVFRSVTPTSPHFNIPYQLHLLFFTPFPALEELNLFVPSPKAFAEDFQNSTRVQRLDIPHLRAFRVSLKGSIRPLWDLLRIFANARQGHLCLELVDLSPNLETPAIVRSLLGEQTPPNEWPQDFGRPKMALQALKWPYKHVILYPVWPSAWPPVTLMQNTDKLTVMPLKDDETTFQEWKAEFFQD
jgi:hypothetical protein